MKVISAIGARPNFIKISSIAKAFSKYNEGDKARKINHVIVHTGQHYDNKMSKLFFDELEIPKPDYDLEVGSGSHAYQTAEIMKRFELIVLEEKPDVIIVVGDVNSTVACSLVASKVEYPITQSTNQLNQRRRPLVAHVEAGLRSFDRTMPEEINRILTDQLSDFLFTTEQSANENLRREGIPQEKIFFVGNTMIDTLIKHKKKAEESNILYKLNLARRQPNNTKNSSNSSNSINPYAILTLHRPSNVDDRKTFQEILEALSVIAKELPIIFPVHPRTLNRIHEFGFESYFDFSLRNPGSVKCLPREMRSIFHRGSTYFTGVQSEIRNKRIHCLNPLGYLDFLHLMTNAKLVLTDSGGIQEETSILGVPCVTLRENTERPVTVTSGTNVVAGTKNENIVKTSLSQINKFNKPLPREVHSLLNRGSEPDELQQPIHPQSAIRNPQFSAPPLWDGMAAKRIVDVLKSIE